MDIQLVAAFNREMTIGKDGDMPWDIPEDLSRFKTITSGTTVVMGRKTLESIGRVLPERNNIVLSRSLDSLGGYIEDKDTSRYHTIISGTAMEIITKIEDKISPDTVSIIGGYDVYNMFICLADKMRITLVETYEEGDTYFPLFRFCDWNVKMHSTQNISKNGSVFHFFDLESKEGPNISSAVITDTKQSAFLDKQNSNMYNELMDGFNEYIF